MIRICLRYVAIELVHEKYTAINNRLDHLAIDSHHP